METHPYFLFAQDEYEPVREVASRERTDSWVEAAAEAGAPPQKAAEKRRTKRRKRQRAASSASFA